MKKTTIKYWLLLSLFAIVNNLYSQCEIKNNAFKNGENISYDLYYHYGIIKAKAGSGFLKTSTVNYRGENVYNISMQLNTSGLARVYRVNDTLTAYVDTNLRPMLFIKNAFEGKDYSQEVQTYNYSGNNIKIRAKRIFNGTRKFDDYVSTNECTYDYLSVLPLIRNLDYSGMKAGDRKEIHFLSGKDIVRMYVNYMGKSKTKANNGKTYNTIDISLTILDKAFNNQKEAIRATLTDDLNRIPIIIETHLKIGSVKAVLKNVSGLKN